MTRTTVVGLGLLAAALGMVAVSIGGDKGSPGRIREGALDEIDPGGRAKRYRAGFEAGKSGTTVKSRALDSTGETLATFRHTKNSGFGIGGDLSKEVD